MTRAETVRDTVTVRDTLTIRSNEVLRDTVRVRQRGDTVIVERSVWRDIERAEARGTRAETTRTEQVEEREKAGGNRWKMLLTGLVIGATLPLLTRLIIRLIKRYVT